MVSMSDQEIASISRVEEEVDPWSSIEKETPVSIYGLSGSQSFFHSRIQLTSSPAGLVPVFTCMAIVLHIEGMWAWEDVEQVGAGWIPASLFVTGQWHQSFSTQTLLSQDCEVNGGKQRRKDSR